DPFENRGQRSGFEDSVSNHENVLSGPFRHVSLGVEQDRLVIPPDSYLTLGQDGVDVVAGDLGSGHADVDVMACEGGDLRPDAVFQPVLAKIRAPWPGDDRHADGIVRTVEAHIAVADKDQRSDI